MRTDQIHFVEHDNEVEEQKYVGLCYSFPRRGDMPFYARNRSDDIEEPGEGRIRDERLLENTQYGDGQIERREYTPHSRRFWKRAFEAYSDWRQQRETIDH